ncbi:MAG: hypothetical protein ACOCWA_09430 [Bacteroidota bacterium]
MKINFFLEFSMNKAGYKKIKQDWEKRIKRNYQIVSLNKKIELFQKVKKNE